MNVYKDKILYELQSLKYILNLGKFLFKYIFLRIERILYGEISCGTFDVFLNRCFSRYIEIDKIKYFFCNSKSLQQPTFEVIFIRPTAKEIHVAIWLESLKFIEHNKVFFPKIALKYEKSP